MVLYMKNIFFFLAHHILCYSVFDLYPFAIQIMKSFYSKGICSTPSYILSFPIWVGLPFTITKSKGQTHWGSRSILVRGRIEDLRLGTKIRENLCWFCLLRKDFVSKFDEENYMTVVSLNEVLTSKVNVFMSYNYAYNNPLMYLIL
ncbi:hypothetical protein PHYBLDRAFT_171795 [Phycomyces blakesleeanus NRRL 1555(-)]|uniref:Uncharacterized protein n=1 Tax=Phycomyces blakesleeanus (strain ATCC 8743b / DSM 1359 / FGSC 10004 / NBRC 33097 / NRRL 1555) TaxID=763407 RepID=A0A162ZY17_PHYB8|nr:hypothetical protein PHYBLDRAFT_171795 [Phycomyces blakesleeanus NRRL 1555(-)]OAD69771.1 hypothetical protein PHYBLDRAFT_171795 [Phycomyces blakesleeanus NRRL 1555(-)]|eukprot:XP_018287811.1 hypothetical protein PHYBLDRAFT_171795 [Phycomyces blakesleeanus NRRL 1555(-)]